MMDPTIISDLVQFGPGIVLAVLVFFAYERQVTAMRELVQENAQVMSKISTLLDAQCRLLSEHDDRAELIHADVRHCSESIARIEPVLTTPASGRTRARP